VFAREVYHRRTQLSAREYCRIAAETEIALRLGDDLPQDGDRSRIAAAVVSAMAAIELIEDLRYDYKRLGAGDGGRQCMVRRSGAGGTGFRVAGARSRPGHGTAFDQRARDRQWEMAATLWATR
jgi:hypothetical protein